jgi:CO dehydrogenase/acetyl-CoA synthase delta subunit
MEKIRADGVKKMISTENIMMKSGEDLFMMMRPSLNFLFWKAFRQV